MLLVLGILFLIVAIVVTGMCMMADMMSDAPGKHVSYLIPIILFTLSVGCFILRHFLHGKAITF